MEKSFLSNLSKQNKDGEENDEMKRDIETNIANLDKINLNNSKDYYCNNNNKNFIRIREDDNKGFIPKNKFNPNNNSYNNNNNYNIKNSPMNNNINSYPNNFLIPKNMLQVENDSNRNNNLNNKIINQN